jgi:hypothetical protein
MNGIYYGSEEEFPGGRPYDSLREYEREKVAHWSLELILRFECEFWNDGSKSPDRILDEILDNECSKWITATAIADLPPRSEVSIQLFNSVVTAFKPFETRTGIKLSTGALDRLLAKFKSFQSRACRFHEEIQHYSRSSVLYCGYCPNIVSAKYPMSLYEVCQHIQFCQRYLLEL